MSEKRKSVRDSLEGEQIVRGWQCARIIGVQVYSERTKEKIYVEIKSGGRSPCFRRLNGTHQIGCTSDPKGNVGVVHYINASADMDWLLDKGPHKPYAVLLSASDFNMEIVSKLKASGKVNGIMVIQIPDREDKYPPALQFSPDKSCPNQGYGLYADKEAYKSCKNVTWNPVGEGLMFQDLSIPIFILTQESDVEFIIEKCYKRFNERDSDGNARQYPLCAVQLKDRMDGAKDSETCTRRTNHQMNLNPDRYCDPMGDKNVYATVKNVNNSQIRENKSVIVVAARMDSFSMFEDFYPSADNHVSGIVALLAAAEAIGKVKDQILDSNTTKDIMFTFFQGEAFDYIGSGRMVYDMEQNKFPLFHTRPYLQKINLSHISHFVEVNQLAYRDEGKVWIHTDPISRSNMPEVKKMIKMLKDVDSSLIDEVPNSQPLPPASVQSFLRKKELPAVVITDHKKEFTNKFYNSRLDLASKIMADCQGLNKTECYNTISKQAQNLTDVANILAKFLFKLATGENSTEDVQVDVNTVNHLLYCYLISPNCELFRQSLQRDKAKDLADTPYPFYVGVNTQTNNYTALTKQMLLVYLGDRMENFTEHNCTAKAKESQALFDYSWIQGPKNETGIRIPYCNRGNANLSDAESIAFQIDGYDFKSREYSTWTESSWAIDAMDVKIFLIPSKKFEVVTLVVGVLILIISLIGGYFLNKRASILFETNSPDSQSPVSL